MSKILIDTTKATSNLTNEENIIFGNYLGSNNDYFQHSKVAIVDEANQQLITISNAYLGGIDRIVQFREIGEAISWLKGHFK